MRLILVVLAFATSLNAQITFGGCVDNHRLPVGAVPNYQLKDVAMAVPNPNGPSVIQFNPQVLSWLTAPTRLFFYAHECAHLAIPTSDESVADCWAARTLVSRGLLSDASLAQVQNDIIRFGRGDWTHLPGPQRAIDIYACVHPGVSQTSNRRQEDSDSLSCSVTADHANESIMRAESKSVQGYTRATALRNRLAEVQANLRYQRNECEDDLARVRRRQERLANSPNDASQMKMLDSEMEMFRDDKQDIANDLAKIRIINKRLAELDE